jgi:5-methyltetrahydropteroyltriglutamate--homocysteine methyltransferase
MPTVIRAETIGSMLRPERLKTARTEHAAGKLSTTEFKRIEDSAVDEAIALQERARLDVVTDGEMRRSTFIGPLTDVVAGVGRVDGPSARWRDEEQDKPQHHPAVIERLKPRRSLAVEEFAYARGRAATPLKVTLPSPLMLALTWSPEHSAAVYADPFECFADAAQIIAAEARALAEIGCQYIQIDAPELATLVDPGQREYYEAVGVPPARLLSEGVDLLNDMVSGVGTRLGLHLCRGNNAGRWLAEGGYDEISARVFRRAGNYDVFLLEYDDPAREGGFEPLRDVPDDKVVVLGLISTKHPQLEDADAVIARIGDAAGYFPRDQLALSPQCGFASVLDGNPVPWEVQEAKLKLVADIAHRVW